MSTASEEGLRPLSTLVYKVAETSTVTDDALESILNEWVGKGWSFDRIQFAMRESSKRPAMAFVVFRRHENGGSSPSAESGG